MVIKNIMNILANCLNKIIIGDILVTLLDKNVDIHVLAFGQAQNEFVDFWNNLHQVKTTHLSLDSQKITEIFYSFVFFSSKIKIYILFFFQRMQKIHINKTL